MKWADIDWRILRGALIALVVAVGVSAGLIAGTYQFRENMQADKQLRNQLLISARDRYQKLDEELRVLETYLPQYEALAEEGIVGPEHRLNWLESLRQAAEQIKLPSLRYQITAQTGFDPEADLSTGVFGIYSSTMELDLGLLHEEDLPALLSALDRLGHGFFRVEECALVRSQREFQRDPARANITARCSLNWLTIRPPGEVETRI